MGKHVVKPKHLPLALPGGARRIHLKGVFDRPVVLNGLRGTRDRPIVVTAGKRSCLTLNTKDGPAKMRRNAWRRQEAGYFPSIGQTADQAALVLHDCQHVAILGLHFAGCIPTAIYLDRTTDVSIVDCHFVGGSIAIAANGIETRDILIEGCEWVQEPALWSQIDWSAVHGSYENAGAGVGKGDPRYLDGDFFRAWDITGNVTVRGNTIADCYNGIHFFNAVDDVSQPLAEPGETPMAMKYNSGRRASVNVLIEDNDFLRVRDNCIEPEAYAWNWVVRDNRFTDCYSPYSFDLQRAAWIYIYDNAHLFTDPPKPETDGGARGDWSGFKPGGGPQRNEGDVYVLNNSWHVASARFRYLRRGRIGRLRHHDNAVQATGRADLFNKGGFDASDATFDGDLFDGFGTLTTYTDQGYAPGLDTRFGRFSFEGIVTASQLRVMGPLRKGVRRAAFMVRLPGYDMAAIAKNGSERAYEITFPPRLPIGAGMKAQWRRRLDRGLAFVASDPIARKRLIGRWRKGKARGSSAG